VPQSAWLLALEVLYPISPTCYFHPMPYEVTATRKRPQSFEQLAGQEFVAATLEKSLETGRIAHAYLFSGPRGCGKTSTARILAKALNCESGPTPHPCGTCDSCRSITAGSSLDVIEIDGASNTSVDNVRQIKDEVLFPPNSGRYKIYIIDEVHMLSTSAFNALLKTIEEPPPYVVFMFATTEQHKVPATIKSRCQQFSFRLVSPDVVVKLLAEAAAELGVKAEAEALLWVARESGGSIRDAYTLLDQIVSFADGDITAALIRDKLGLVGQDRMNGLFRLFSSGDTAGALGLLDEVLSSGVSVEQFTADVVEYCRAIMLIKHGIARESLLGAPLGSFDMGVVESITDERMERALSIFLSAYRLLKDSVDPRYELDLAVAKASHLQDYIPPSEIAKAIATVKRFVEKGQAPVRQVSAAPAPERRNAERQAPERSPAERQTVERPPAEKPPRPAEATANPLPAGGRIEDPQELRKALISDIRKNNVLLATTLEKSGQWRIEADTIHIPAAQRMECDLLGRFSGLIAEIAGQRSGTPRKIHVEQERQGSILQDSEPSDKRPSPGAADRQTQPNPVTGSDKEAISLVERFFKGKLVGIVDASASEPLTSASSFETAALPPESAISESAE